MPSESTRPQYLTKRAVKTIVDAKEPSLVKNLKPIFQILTVRDVRSKKNMKDKLSLSDGTHKIICIVKEKINSKPEQTYKPLDIIRINEFNTKLVGKVKVMIPTGDFDII